MCSFIGLVGSFILYAISTFYIWLGLVVLVDCGERHKLYDYSTLAQHAFGIYGGKIMDLAVIINNFGSLLSYVTIVSGTGSQLVNTWICSGSEYCGVYFITSYLALFVVLPQCLLHFYGHLGFTSLFSILSIACVIIFVIIVGPLSSRSNGPLNVIDSYGNYCPFYYCTLLNWRKTCLGTLQKIGSVVFALSCAQATFHAFVSMFESNIERWKYVVSWSCGSGATLLMAMGIGKLQYMTIQLKAIYYK